MKWKVLNSSYLFRGKWLTVRKDQVRLPSGYVMNDFFVLEYPEWVNVIAITEDGLFVIEEQYRHGLQRVNFELCAGCVEKDETPLQAAQRELLEETGFGGGTWSEFMVSSPNPNSMNNLCYTFFAVSVQKIQEPLLEKTEDINVHLFKLEEVIEMLNNYSIIEGNMQASLWKYINSNNK